MNVYITLHFQHLVQHPDMARRALGQGCHGVMIDAGVHGDLEAMSFAFRVKKAHEDKSVGIRFHAAGAASGWMAAGLCGLDFVCGDYLKHRAQAPDLFQSEYNRVRQSYPGLSIFTASDFRHRISLPELDRDADLASACGMVPVFQIDHLRPQLANGARLRTAAIAVSTTLGHLGLDPLPFQPAHLLVDLALDPAPVTRSDVERQLRQLGAALKRLIRHHGERPI